MVVTQQVSWHPIISNCAASATGTKLHIIELFEDDTVTSTYDTPSITCFDWKHTSRMQVAYGTSTGNVVILDPGRGDETILGTKRSCNSVCWSHLDKHKIAVGLEAMKGLDSSVFIWDLEHDVTLKMPISESCSAIAWQADHPQQLLFGNSMGTLRLVDLRIHHTAASSAASSAVYSIQAHPASRPRRIKGIRVNPLLSNVAATFSDAAGDVVKIWDLRTLGSSSSQNSNKSIPLFTINPYLYATGNAIHHSHNHPPLPGQQQTPHGYVADIAWSPRSAFTLATATSCQAAVHVFRCDGFNVHANMDMVMPSSASSSSSLPSPVVSVGNTPQQQINSHLHPHAGTAASSQHQHHVHSQPLPELTVPLSEPAKSISWQGDNKRCAKYRNFLLSSSVNSLYDFNSLTTPTVYARENLQSMRMSTQMQGKEDGIWESSRAEERHKTGPLDDDFARQQRRHHTGIACASLKNNDCFGLLAINTNQGLSISPTQTETAVAVSFTTGHFAIGDNPRRSLMVAPCEGLYSSATLGDYMTASAEDRQRDRALAGYNHDIASNVEILNEEATMLSATIAKLRGTSQLTQGNVHSAQDGSDAATTRELLKLKRALIQVQEVQRVWQWLARLLAVTQSSTPSTSASILLQSGARGLMRHLQASTPFIPTTQSRVKMPTPSAVVTSDSMFNKTLGLVLYTSKARADILSLLCAWPATTTSSANSNEAVVEVSSSSVTTTPVSLECQAVRLLWRGQIDQAVTLLLSGLNAGAANKKATGAGSAFLHHHHAQQQLGTSVEYETLVEMTAQGLSGYQPNAQNELPSYDMVRSQSSTTSLDKLNLVPDGFEDKELLSLNLRRETSDGLSPLPSSTKMPQLQNRAQNLMSPGRRASHVHAVTQDNGDVEARKLTGWARTVHSTLDRWQRYANSARHHAMLQPPTARLSLPVHRTNQIYLRAALQFLLVAEEHSCSMPLSTTNNIDDWKKRQSRQQSRLWRQFLQESDIMQQIPFLDRLAFASIYLKDDDFFGWIDSQITLSTTPTPPSPTAVASWSAASNKGQKSLEALALVGLETADSVHLLQAHIDSCDDIQTAALLAVAGVFRQRNSALTSPPPSGGNIGSNASTSSSNLVTNLVNNGSNSSGGAAPVASVVDVDRMLARWVVQYRQLLIHWEMVVQRVALDEAVNTQAATFPYVFFTNYQGYDANAGRRTQAFIDTCTVFKTTDALPKDLVKKHMANSALRLRCTYCGSALPPLHQLIDLWKQKQREIGRLKNEKKVLNFCIKCSQRQHLPRCYVCQLFVGMLNPYRLVESLTEQGKQQKDAILLAQRQYKQQQQQQQIAAAAAAAASASSASDSNTSSTVSNVPTMTSPSATMAMRSSSMQKGGYPHARPPPHQGAATSAGRSGVGPGNAGRSASSAFYQNRMMGGGRGGPPPRGLPSSSALPPSLSPATAPATDAEDAGPTTPSSVASDSATTHSGNDTPATETPRPVSFPSNKPTSSTSTLTSSASVTPGEAAAAALAAAVREQREKEKSTFNDLALPFDDWLLYCQRCRHGGHSICLRRWFSRMTSQAEVELDVPSTFSAHNYSDNDEDEEDENGSDNDDGDQRGDDNDEDDILLCYPVDHQRGREGRSASNAKRLVGGKADSGKKRKNRSKTQSAQQPTREKKRQVCGVNGCECQCDLSFE